jgi:hypothetical protein
MGNRKERARVLVHTRLDVVDLDVLGAAVRAGLLFALVAIRVVVELEATVAVVVGAHVRLVDLGRLGELAVALERARLVGGVFLRI